MSLDAFMSRVAPVPEAGCWLFTGTWNSWGYGWMRINGRPVGAHRRAYELASGEPIPPGLLVLHKCDTPACCNPAHLYLGRTSDNQRDAVRRGRHVSARKTHCKRGHEFTPENTGPRTDKPGRVCRACDVMKHRAQNERRRGGFR